MNLDIIIPTLNERENLSNLLPYLQRHKSATTTVYVVDSFASDDDSYSICQQYDTKYIKSDHAQRSIQLNEGAKQSNGNTLMFLHADVIPPTKFEEHIHKVMSENIEAGFFSYKFDKSTFFLNINAKFTKYDGLFAGGGDQCHFFSRSLFERMQGYKEDQELMEDFEMIDRLRDVHQKFKIVDDPAIVSARKYEKNSYLKVNWVNLMTFIKFKNKVPSSDLKAYYKKALN